MQLLLKGKPKLHHLRDLTEPYGKEVKAYTERQLSGRQIWLEFDVQERDNYGRLLAYVWLEPPSPASEEEVRAKMFQCPVPAGRLCPGHDRAAQREVRGYVRQVPTGGQREGEGAMGSGG